VQLLLLRADGCRRTSLVPGSADLIPAAGSTVPGAAKSVLRGIVSSVLRTGNVLPQVAGLLDS